MDRNKSKEQLRELGVEFSGNISNIALQALLDANVPVVDQPEADITEEVEAVMVNDNLEDIDQPTEAMLRGTPKEFNENGRRFKKYIDKDGNSLGCIRI